MSSDNKREVYHAVQQEIKEYEREGDLLFSEGYFNDAIKSYEMVNFYEGKSVISKERIKRLKNEAARNAKKHYYRAVQYQKKDKRHALSEYNIVLRNDPTYKDAKVRLESLKKDPAIETFLQSLEKNIRSTLYEDISLTKTLKKLHKAVKDLSFYDDNNHLVLYGKKLITQERKELFRKAVASYNKGRFTQSENYFKRLEALNPKDNTVKQYLELNSILIRAEEALKKEDYTTTLALSKKALNYDPDNKDALKFVELAKKESEKKIPELLDLGKALYEKQDYKKAKTVFQSVLHFDENNNTSLAYIKKIDQQLKTIKSLQ